MKLWLLAFYFFTLATPAFAGEIALMVNMNYSVAEWKRFRASAIACGRTPVSVPHESLLPYGEALFNQRDALDRQIQALRPRLKKNEREGMVADIMREGLKWDRDPELRDQLAGEIQSLRARVQELDRLEREQGTIMDQLRAKSAEIKQAGHTVGAMAFSAHSDGWNLTGESANRLSSSELRAVMSEFPRAYRDVRHVLMLGCYNMTDNNRPHWRSFFPYATLMAGFGKKAPSRSRPVALDFISENLGLACELDEEMLTKGRPLKSEYVQNRFLQLLSNRNTESIVDYCYEVTRGQNNGGQLDCDEEWTTFLAQAETIQSEYMDLSDLKKNPPLVDGPESELRRFYNTLQTTCPAENAPQMANEVQNAETFRRSLRESTIRLIFWWKVQKNFKTFYGKELGWLNQSIQNAGIEASLPELDGKTGRVEFIRAFNAVRDGLAEQRHKLNLSRARRLSSADLQAVNDALARIDDAESRLQILLPLYNLQGEQTLGINMTNNTESTLARGAIPFNWIEGTVLRRRDR